MSDTADEPTGPLNPRGSSGPDAPAAPGGPMRTDAPAGTTTPGGPDDPPQEPEPEVHPSSLPDGPQTIPAPTTDGERHPRTQTDQANEQLQEENAETSLGQPSDSGE
jgi:hypothetical protein